MKHVHKDRYARTAVDIFEEGDIGKASTTEVFGVGAGLNHGVV